MKVKESTLKLIRTGLRVAVNIGTDILICKGVKLIDQNVYNYLDERHPISGCKGKLHNALVYSSCFALSGMVSSKTDEYICNEFDHCTSKLKAKGILDISGKDEK